METIIALIAVSISVMTFGLSLWNAKDKAGRNHVTSLEERLNDLEKRLSICESFRENLFKENIELLRQLAVKKL